jgi:hypothetical protein
VLADCTWYFCRHVRLGTCIALELALAAGAVGGVWLGIGRVIDVAGDYLSAHEAAAATEPHAPESSPAALPGARLRVETPAVSSTVFGSPDDVLLAPLAASPVTRVKINHGGTSLSLRLDFASGARASFKPQQVHPQSDPRREIAAYRIDRLLGIGHVSPSKSVAFPIAELIAVADPTARNYTEQRITEEAISRGGIVRGEVQWWIPEIRDVTIGKYRVDEPAGIAEWEPYLQAGVPIPDAVHHLVEQLSTCIVFDVLIDNADRWTGNNTKGSLDNKTLYYMDNTLSFSIYTYGHEANLTPLRQISVFSRRLIERLRSLTARQINEVLASGDDAGDLAPLLEPAEVRAILGRRDHIMQYIDGLIEEYGEAKVLALP